MFSLLTELPSIRESERERERENLNSKKSDSLNTSDNIDLIRISI